MLGIGLYQGATYQAHPGVNLYLCHLCPEVAVAIRAANKGAFIVGRFDCGDDGAQVNFASPDPVAEANRFWAREMQPVLQSHPGVYDAAVGICEAWSSRPPAHSLPANVAAHAAALTWRARFELTLCRLVQWAGYKYCWGSVSTGNLDTDELPVFADVIRAAWATCYHGYLGPNQYKANPTDDGPYYAFRPTRLWAGLPTRLIYTEVGPYYPTGGQYGSLAQLEISVARALRDDCRLAGIEWVGACVYGVGLLGGQARGGWNIDGAGQEAVVTAAASFPSTIAVPPKPVPPKPVPPKPAPAKPAPAKGATPMQDYQSPNHDGPRASTTGIVVHSTRGGSGSLESELDGTMSWENRPNGDSCHAVVSPTRTGLPVRDNLIAWHCRARNAYTLGIEFCQSRLGDFIPDSELQRGAQVCAGWCIKYGIPAAWGLNVGFVQHKDTPEGHSDGKSDIGAGFDGDRFMVMVRTRIAEMTAPAATVDKTTDALNGLAHYIAAAQSAPNLAAAKTAADAAWNKMAALKASIGR